MRPPSSHQTLVWGLVGLAGAAATWGLATALLRLEECNAHRNPVAAALLAGGCASVPLLALAGRRLRRDLPATGPLLRWTFVAGVLLWFLYAAVAGTYHRARVGCVAATWATTIAFQAWRLPVQARRPGRVALAALALALALLAGEVVLRTVAALAPNPLFARSTASAAQRLAAHAFAPGQRHFGFPTNELGFYDAPFAPRSSARRPTVAVIGDSFSASFVPHALHYTTVAERALGDTDVWNIGWPAIGPAEYAALLQEHVLPLDPDVVVVSLFLGNDLAETLPWQPLDRALADWFDRGNVLLCEVPRRLWRLSRGGATSVPGRTPAGESTPAAAWSDDPRHEPGTFPEPEFLRLETERAANACTPDDPSLPAMLEHLRTLRALAGARPFGFVLIPDEFMVEDGLWQKVAPPSGQRHLLRDTLVAFCRDEAIACLDLLPALLAAAPREDGDRHLYLRRDTHWNGRGNARAGAALTPFLRNLLAARSR